MIDHYQLHKSHTVTCTCPERQSNLNFMRLASQTNKTVPKPTCYFLSLIRVLETT